MRLARILESGTCDLAAFNAVLNVVQAVAIAYMANRSRRVRRRL